MFGPLADIQKMSLKAEGEESLDLTDLADTADKAVILINQLRQNIIYMRQKVMLTTMHSFETVAKEKFCKMIKG